VPPQFDPTTPGSDWPCETPPIPLEPLQPEPPAYWIDPNPPGGEGIVRWIPPIPVYQLPPPQRLPPVLELPPQFDPTSPSSDWPREPPSILLEPSKPPQQESGVFRFIEPWLLHPFVEPELGPPPLWYPPNDPGMPSVPGGVIPIPGSLLPLPPGWKGGGSFGPSIRGEHLLNPGSIPGALREPWNWGFELEIPLQPRRRTKPFNPLDPSSW